MSHASSVIVRTFTQQTAMAQQSAKEVPFQDLAHLKKEDPFLYYSIPSVRNAVLLNKDVELSSATSRHSDSELTGIINQYFTVTRQSRLTFEFHSSKLMEDLIDLSSDGFDSDEDNEQEDDLYSFLMQIDSNPQSPSSPSMIAMDSVPTLTENKCEEQNLCTKCLSSEHLQLLKTIDPFRHFTMPAIKNATLPGKCKTLFSLTPNQKKQIK